MEAPADPPAQERPETRRRLEGYLASFPGHEGRVCRLLLLHMHKQGRVRIEDVYRQAQRKEELDVPADPNRPATRLWAAEERKAINQIVLHLASKHLTPQEVDDLIWASHRRNEAQSLENLARIPGVPLDLIADKVRQYANLPESDEEWAPPEGTRVALIRRFISDHVDYISVAKRYLRVRDMSWILDRVKGTERGAGMVGGKAAGMILAWAILRSREREPIQLPASIFVLTDAYNSFKQLNGLSDLEDQKYRPIDEIRADFPAIREIFRNAEFPTRIKDVLRDEMRQLGEVPLIVRSSSLLEDSFGATFSGIYKSIFLPNQGPIEERLRELMAAIAEIYASVFSPDAIQYRRARHLLDHDERMAVMIQGVVGSRRQDWYYPDFSGVAFSRNDYRWSPRIKREDGLARLVVGLGTHAVDRVGDYARMVPLQAPTLRPEGTPEEIRRASQKQVDVVDLAGGGFRTVPAAEALERMRSGGIADYVSVAGENDDLSSPIADLVLESADRLYITFERLLSRAAFPRRIAEMLRSLQEAYECPVDVEFAVDRGTLFILQCRPLGEGKRSVTLHVPDDVPESDKIFSAHKYISSGSIDDIRYLVLIDPRDYGPIPTVGVRLAVARAVGHINDALSRETFVLLGPGRWGSQDCLLGVPVTYADICNARALVEIARTAEGYAPEPSFGTHFFQDLVEASILYLPLYPGEPGVIFNDRLLRDAENAVGEISPADAHLSEVVRVIDAESIAPGRRIRLILDGDRQEALCFLRH